MKFFKSISLIFMVLVFLSCENEPVDPNVVPKPPQNKKDVSGSYKMTEYNTSIPTDLDGDGTTSTNQMDETTCFSNNIITISNDNTYTAILNSVGIAFDGSTYSFDCLHKPNIAGTWQLKGSLLNLTNYTFNNIPLSITVSENKLVSRINGEIFTKSDSGQPVSISGTIEMVFVKQN